MADPNPMLAYVTPDQRRRMGNAMMAEQYNRATPEEGNVAQRHGLLPLAIYDNGQPGLAFPGLVAEPAQSFNRLLQHGYQAGARDAQGVEDAFNVAGAAMMGGLAAPRPRGVVGSAGGDLSSKGAVVNALDMSHAARMQRADEMGFHPATFYHGTVGDFPLFDLAKGGQVSASRVGSQGVSVTPSTGVANEFANLASSKSGGNGSVMPLRARLGKVGSVSLDGSEKNLEVATTLSSVFKNGYDTVVLKNYSTPGGSKGNVVLVVKDPAQLRSVNAAFDPEKINSPNLLYANGGKSGTALNAMMQQYGYEPQPYRPASPQYRPGDA